MEEFLAKLHLDRFNKVPLLEKIEDMTRGTMKPSYTIAAAAIIGIILLFTGPGFHLVYHLVVLGYPAYLSYKAIKSPDDRDDERWLTYWIIFGFVHAFDSVLKYLFFWLPFYSILKLVFLVYVFLPRSNGSVVVFKYVISPILSKYEDIIDKYIKQTEDAINEGLLKGTKQVVDHAMKSQ